MSVSRYTIIPSNLYFMTMAFTIVYLLGGEVVLHTSNFIFQFIKYVAILLMLIQTILVFSKYTLGWRILILFSFALSLIVGIINGKYFSMLATCALVFGAKGLDYKKLLQYYFSISSFFCISIITLCRLGIIRDNIAEPDNRFNLLTSNYSIRHSFGYVWPTDFATHVFFILLTLWIIKKGRLNLLLIMVYLVIPYLIVLYTDSRLGAGCIVLLVIFSLFIQIREKCGFNFSKINLFYVFWIPLIAFVVLFLTYHYNSSDDFWVLLDTMLSERLRLGNEAFQDYGVKLFGQYYVQYGGQNSGDFYNFIDSSYIQLIIIYGAIYTFLFLSGFVTVAFKAYKRKDMAMLLAIFVAGISGAIAQHFLQIFMNPILLGLTAKHKD